MAFCTECGSNLSPGARFCESCGAPVPGQPAGADPQPPVISPVVVPVSAPGTVPQQQPAVSPPRSSNTALILIIGISIVLVLAIIGAAIWFVGLPYLEKSGMSSSVKPAQSPGTITDAVVTADSATGFSQGLAIVPVTTTSARKLEGRYEEYYNEIYTLDRFFAYGASESYTHDLKTPPLYVKYELTPKMLTREKVINIGMSTEETILVTYPNPNAWFEIKVINADNGAVVESYGYGKDYSDVTKSEFMVRTPGNYRIEFSGSDVTAAIHVLEGTG